MSCASWAVVCVCVCVCVCVDSAPIGFFCACRELNVRLMCRAVLYTGSPGQRVKAHADYDHLEQDESEWKVG